MRGSCAMRKGVPMGRLMASVVASRIAVAAAGVMVLLLGAGALGAQAQTPRTAASWRGAGPTPCVGSDGGVYKCPAAPQTIAVRAGRLFDSTRGTMLANQVIV